MKQITVYRTYSFGGMEGRDKEVRTFETESLARTNAMVDTWNDNFSLYRVEIIFDGWVREEETFIATIPCGRDKAAIAYEKDLIAEAEAEIEKLKANKRLKESTRAERISKEEGKIGRAKQRIKYLETK